MKPLLVYTFKGNNRSLIYFFMVDSEKYIGGNFFPPDPFIAGC